MSDINFEEDSNDNNVLATTDKTASKVLNHVNNLGRLNNELADLEIKMKRVQDSIKKIEEYELPLAMDEANISKLTLTNGQVLKLKNVIACSIPKEREAVAFGWLREHNYGDLIKREIKTNFGKGEDERANEVVKKLTELGIQVTDKASVHHSTLNGFAREQFEAGKPLPTEIFNVYTGRKAVIGSK